MPKSSAPSYPRKDLYLSTPSYAHPELNSRLHVEVRMDVELDMPLQILPTTQALERDFERFSNSIELIENVV